MLISAAYSPSTPCSQKKGGASKATPSSRLSYTFHAIHPPMSERRSAIVEGRPMSAVNASTRRCDGERCLSLRVRSAAIVSACSDA